jgi:peptidoglycan/LPS O-acetylase OafA/YrhL
MVPRGRDRYGQPTSHPARGDPTPHLPTPLTRKQTVSRSATLGVVFDPRHNALNALRLALAVSVIVWHSFPLSGADIDLAPLRQVVSRISVDGFFAISGYLIVSSWVRDPRWLAFLRARALRILPAFWTCLVVTAAVFAPLAVFIRGSAFPPDLMADSISYVVRNAALYMVQYDIAGTPNGVPYPNAWNGALWTLFWEASCYVGVLAVGLLGLIRHRATFPALFIVATAGVLATSYGPVENFYVVTGSRFGIMFLAGALIYRYRDLLPVSPVLMTIAGLAIAASAWLSDYRIAAALPIAYLVICLGALGKSSRLRVRNDLSYGTYIYGFPLQQLLATAGASAWGVPAFAVVSIMLTLPIAAASWFLVEKPALRLKASHRRPAMVTQETIAGR